MEVTLLICVSVDLYQFVYKNISETARKTFIIFGTTFLYSYIALFFAMGFMTIDDRNEYIVTHIYIKILPMFGPIILYILHTAHAIAQCCTENAETTTINDKQYNSYSSIPISP